MKWEDLESDFHHSEMIDIGAVGLHYDDNLTGCDDILETIARLAACSTFELVLSEPIVAEAQHHFYTLEYFISKIIQVHGNHPPREDGLDILMATKLYNLIMTEPQLRVGNTEWDLIQTKALPKFMKVTIVRNRDCDWNLTTSTAWIMVRNPQGEPMAGANNITTMHLDAYFPPEYTADVIDQAMKLGRWPLLL
jgi:hypothetical protein